MQKSHTLAIFTLLLVLSLPGLADVPFEHVVVDGQGPKDPWAKIVGDIDGDGFADIIIGGRNGPLVWYSYPDWSKSVISEGGYKTVDGEAGDVDGDGDLDIVMGGLFWYENPRPNGKPTGKLWVTHKVADHPTHDVELADLDGDGDMDIVTRDQSEFGHKAGDKIHVWRQDPGDKWTEKVIACPHGEGIVLGDIDKDGDADIVIGGVWFENSGSIVEGTWAAHRFGQWHPSAAVQVCDINGDSRPDVILSPSELKGQSYKLVWFEAPRNPRDENWREHVIAEPVECVFHGMAVGDIDGDGAMDIVASEMHQGDDPDEVIIYINRQKGSMWTKQVVSTRGSHCIRVADIGNDGDLDIMGANWSGGYQPVELWENKSSRPGNVVSIEVNAAGYERYNKPVEVDLNFTKLLEQAGRKADFNETSMRLTEVDTADTIIDDSIMFQFDKAKDYDAVNNAKGTLTFIANGITPANSKRTFALCLGDVGNAHSLPSFEPLVSITDGIQFRSQESFKIETPKATYYYHKQGAGFAAILDKDGNDWLGYRPGGGPAGEYRGIPNMGHPEGYCHPGNTVSNSVIINRGPVKVSILSESNDKKMRCLWDIFPSYARLTVLKMRTPYWFLYEGTPGGKLDEDSDYCVRPGARDGNRTLTKTKWDADIPAADGGGEWLYFRDSNRAIYLIHHEDDEAIDSYWPMQGEMTVFGFGRKGLNKFMQTVPSHFTVGLCEGSTHTQFVKTINSAYCPLAVNVGNTQVISR